MVRCLTALLFLTTILRADLAVMTWNLAGNGATNWATNMPQVQAIGRILRHLQPDVVAFQEIPFDYRFRMAGIVQTYLPGYYFALSTGTDGFLAGGIASRHPIARSTSYLDGANLTAFGFDGRFARDLFEAEIAVPTWPKPFHIFTTHLRAGANYQQRAAEAAAVSNHIARNFLPAYGDRPWLLCGDLNQDIRQPPSPNLRPIERLINTNLGTVLLTPTNVVASMREWTWSARAGLDIRFDYVIPGSVLATNVVSGALFYSLTVGNTVPGIDRNTSPTASDHLPVIIRFRDPFPAQFSVTGVIPSPDTVELGWDAPVSGFSYRIERTTNFSSWMPVAGGLRTNRHVFPRVADTEWYRVIRSP